MFFEAYRGRKFRSDLQMAFVLLVARHTWSAAGGAREYTKELTAATVAKELGSNVDSAQAVMVDAAKRGLVHRRKCGIAYAFRTGPEMWAAAKPHEPVVVPLKPKVVEVDPEPDEPEELAAELVEEREPVERLEVAPPVSSAPIVVEPGAVERLEIPVTQVKTVAYSNQSPAPLAVVATIKAGTLHLRIEAGSAANLRSALRRYVKRPLLREHLDELFIDAGFGPIREQLYTSICNKLGSKPSDAFVCQFIDAKLVTKRRKGALVEPGLFEGFAVDARRAWAAWYGKNGTPSADPAPAIASSSERINMLAYALQILAESPADIAANSVIEGAIPSELAAARRKAAVKGAADGAQIKQR